MHEVAYKTPKVKLQIVSYQKLLISYKMNNTMQFEGCSLQGLNEINRRSF